MALIQVTTATLRRQETTLQSLNARLRSQVSDMESKELELSTMWDGDAKEAFHAAFNSDKTQFENFSVLLDQYVNALEEIAVEYDNKEAANLEIASTRSY